MFMTVHVDDDRDYGKKGEMKKDERKTFITRIVIQKVHNYQSKGYNS